MIRRPPRSTPSPTRRSSDLHNVYELETRLGPSYPTVPPETRVLTKMDHCPHLLEGQMLCLWRQGSTRTASRWDPAQFTDRKSTRLNSSHLVTSNAVFCFTKK